MASYFDLNKDVADAYQQNSNGMTADAFAAWHYNNYGVNEGRAPVVQAPAPDAQQGPALGGGMLSGWAQQAAPQPAPNNPTRFNASQQASIKNAYEGLKNDPAGLAAAMQQHGVTQQDMQHIVGPGYAAPQAASSLGQAPAPALAANGAYNPSQQANIKSVFDAVKNDPRRLAATMKQHGMTAEQIAGAVGTDAFTLNSYINSVGSYGGLGGMPPAWDDFVKASNPGPGSGGGKFSVGGSAPGGAGGAGGTGSSSSGSSSSSYGDSVNRNVNYGSETIEGRLGNLLGMDANGNYTNGVIRQAAENAMAQFASRGLLNSSMATEAATQAAMAKAIEIAGPDAQTYFSQGRANQDAQNVFKRDDKGYAQEIIMLDKAQALDREKMVQAGSQFNQELAFKYEALKLDKNSQNEATSLAHKYALEMNNIKAVDSSFDLYLRRISEIDNNKDLTADAKAQMKNSAGKDFDLYAKAKGIVYDQQFGGRYETGILGSAQR